MLSCCRVGSLDGRADREAGGWSFADLLGTSIASKGERQLQDSRCSCNMMSRVGANHSESIFYEVELRISLSLAYA